MSGFSAKSSGSSNVLKYTDPSVSPLAFSSSRWLQRPALFPIVVFITAFGFIAGLGEAQVIVLRDGGQWEARLNEATAALESGDGPRGFELLQSVIEQGHSSLLPLSREAEASARKNIAPVPQPNPRARFAPPVRALRVKHRPTGGHVVYVPASELARRRLAGQPPELLEVYSRMYEPRARARLQEALAADDGVLLESVGHNYPVTPSGRRARMVLADRFFVDGNFRRAYREFDRLLKEGGLTPAIQRHVALRYLATIRILGQGLDYGRRRAAVVARVGAGAKFERELREMESTVAMGTQPEVVVAPNTGDQARSSFRFTLPRLANGVDEYRHEWLQRLWGREENGIVPSEKVYQIGRVRDLSGYLVFQPAFSEDSVYISGVFRTWRVDLESGKLVADPVKPFREPRPKEFQEGGESPLYRATIDGDDIYVHWISDLVHSSNYMRYLITEDLPTRSLVVYDRRTVRGSAAKVRWDTRRFFAGSPEDPKWVSLVSPPLVGADAIYVAGVYQAGFFTSLVAALDRETGEPLWQTRTVSHQMELTMFGEAAREPFATILVADEGIIYALTQFGAVAALRARDGQMLWLSTYGTIPTTPTLGPTPELRPLAWSTNAPLLVDGVLYVAPRDSTAFCAIDTGLRVVPFTSTEGHTKNGVERSEGGRILARHQNIGGGELRDVLGYRHGRVYFSGPGGVQALDVSRVVTTRAMPRLTVPRGTNPQAKRNLRSTSTRSGSVGRGVMADRGVVFSTHRQIVLVDYDLKDTVFLTTEDFPVRYGQLAGNVALWDGKIFLMSRQVLSCFAPGPPVSGEDS